MRNGLFRIYKGIKPIPYFPIDQQNGANLREPLVLSAQAGGLRIKNDEFTLKRRIRRTVYRFRKIVDKIVLDPVNDLEIPAILPNGVYRIHGIRIRLYYPVIRDCDGFVPPLESSLDQIRRFRNAVHC